MSKKKSLGEMNALEFYAELSTLKDNPAEFLKYCKIYSDRGLIQFRPYAWQKRKITQFVQTLHTKKPNHLIVAPRQVGKTALIAAYALWYALFRPDKRIVLFSYKLAAAEEILRRIREMHAMLPKCLQRDTKVCNKDMIQFDNNTRIGISNYNANCVRGMSIDLAILDEAAFAKDSTFSDFIKSVFPIQCGRKDAQMIIVSTPSKIKSEFYMLYSHLLSNDSSFNVEHLKWNCISSRDAKWKKQMQHYHDTATFRSEFLAEFV